MQEACYCGRVGEVEDRRPVVLGDGRSGLACPECGHTDDLEWMPEEARKLLVEKAIKGSTLGGMPSGTPTAA